MRNSFDDWSFRWTRLLGVDVHIHWTFVIYIVLMMLQSGAAWQYQAVFLAVLFVTVLMHEFGHCWAARKVGMEARKILLWPLGGLAYVGETRSLSDEIKVVLGGPLTHIPVALVMAAVLKSQGAEFFWSLNPLGPVQVMGGPEGWLGLIEHAIFSTQVWLFCFNMFLPAYPLDGGRLLIALLLPRLGKQRTGNLALFLGALCGIYMFIANQVLIGVVLLAEAAEFFRLRQSGALAAHPALRFHVTPMLARKAQPMLKVLPPLPKAGKTCSTCGRTLPANARMCGFCEKPV